MKRAGWAVACAIAPVVYAACGGDDGTTTAGDAGSDATVDASLDASKADVGGDVAVDAGMEAAVDAPSDASDASSDAPLDVDAGLTTYNDITQASFWTTYDIAPLGGGITNGLYGTTFDGRYVYAIGANGFASGRYDTQGAFDAGTSWTTYDSTNVTGVRTDYAGAAFDGRYVYLVPSSASSGAANVTRYDTMGAGFATSSSWSWFNTTSVDARAKGFSGAAFDGRYMYFAPNYNGAPDGITARYDTQAALDAGASWATFDTSTLTGAPRGLNGAVFDGRYVYFAPSQNARAVRYDTQASYGAAASWATFDIASANASASTYFGGCFDGRYVYFAPSGATTIAARFDTQGTFGSSASWSTFDVLSVFPTAKYNYGCNFDGRFVYYVPSQGGHVVRVDTTASFTSGASWSMFDTTTLSANAASYGAAAFDGRYMYFIPILGGTHVVVARFDAKSPKSMPALPQYHGSFY